MWKEFSYREMKHAFEDPNRERFEQWLLRRRPDIGIARALISGEYLNSKVESAWVAWQESRAELAKELDKLPETAVLAKGEVEFLLASSSFPNTVTYA